MGFDFMEGQKHCHGMRFVPMLFALLSAGLLHAAEGIRILSADPADNVLLEITTDTPRAVMSSSDLKTWKYVFHYVPTCQNFKAYAPQQERKQTYYRLAPVHPEYAPLLLDPGIPSVVGKGFWGLGWVFSFSEGGTGTVNSDASDAGDFENLNYSIVDSRPGMVSVRTWVADGHKRDHLILIPAPDARAKFNDAVVFSADRFGDATSQIWADGYFNGPERPPAPSTMPDPAGLVVEFTGSQAIAAVVTLGPNGTASILRGGVTEAGSYDYVATGPTRATLRVVRMDGTRKTAFLRIESSYAFYQTADAPPYSITGYGAVRLISPPAGNGG
jgi:hypothetical protein